LQQIAGEQQDDGAESHSLRRRVTYRVGAWDAIVREHRNHAPTHDYHDEQDEIQFELQADARR